MMLGKKMFKGKLKDLRRALLAGELGDDEAEIDFMIDAPSEHDAPSKSAPLSAPKPKQKMIDALGMKEDKSEIKSRNNWTIPEMEKLPRGDSKFIDKFFKMAGLAGYKIEIWPEAEKVINSEVGQFLQQLAMMAAQMEAEKEEKKGGIPAAAAMAFMMGMKRVAGDVASDGFSPNTLNPDEAIAENSPLWFKQKLQSILKDNLQSRPVGGRLSGELSFKRLYKIKSNARVFQRKHHDSKKQYNVVLLIDCSGSMQGEKAQTAAICASLLSRDLQSLVRLKIKTFNERNMTVKGFDEKFKACEVKVPMNRIINEVNAGHGVTNHDWFAIHEADMEIRQEKGEKIVIIISDSDPCCCPCCDSKALALFGNTSSWQWLSAKCQEVHTRGQVRLASITVGPRGTEDVMNELYHKNYSQIDRYSQIYNAVTTILSKAIKRR